MDDRLTYRPTLVVGIGGTGCEIAEGVYREARANRLDQRGRIAVLGLDTDINDIQKRTAIDPHNIVQISSLDTVYQILHKNPEAEASFCLGRAELPNRLLNMKLIEGAAQIRMFSHLALFDQLKRHSIQIESTIGNIISTLARHDGRTEFEGVLNIIVCGSLAGATGSGIAVQIALLLRRIAKDRGVVGTQVRGVFFLPDVFVRAASLGSQQIDNVLANGYASLKELNATIARAEDMESARGFELEFAPGRFLQSSEAPFESVTLIDYENLTGGNLGVNLANYKQLAIRTVYLQTFSSVGKETLSRTINDAQAGVEAASRRVSNIFAAVGIAAVKYPADLIADFLGYRFAQDLLAGDWLRLDRAFREEMRRYEELKASGNLSQRQPDIATSYLESLDQFARRDRIAFFIEIGENLNPIVVDPETHEEKRLPLHRQFLDAFLHQFSETFWSNQRMSEIRSRGTIDPSSFRIREMIESIVRTCENLLDLDFQAIETALSERPDRIFNNMITVDDDRAVAELQPHSIKFFTVRGGPHPIQVRAFLYEATRAARAMMNAIDVEQLRKNVITVANVFLADREPSEEGVRRSNLAVLERAREATRPGMIGRLVGSTGKFIEDYVGYYDESIEKLRAYAEGTLRRKALAALLAELEPLAATYEGLFAEVERSLIAIDDNVRKLEQRYAANESFDGNVYVYADVKSKLAAWEEFRQRTIATRQSEGVNTALNAAVYDKHRSDRKSLRRSTSFAGLRELFEAEVIEKFALEAVKRDHRAVWDMSVIDAIQRETQVTGLDWKERLKQAVELVKAQAEPFVRLQDPSNGQVMVFWAAPAEIREEYGNGDEFDRLLTFQQGERPLIAPDFSRCELLCVNSRVNLELTHFAKLDPGIDRTNANEPTRGRYQRAYAERVAKLIEEEIALRSVGATDRTTSVLTPHIHREWHRASRLPEIFPALRQRIRHDLQRATLVAFGIGLLQKENDYERSLTYFSTVGRLASLSIRYRLVDSHDTWQIYKAFRDRGDLVYATNGVWAAEKAALQPVAQFGSNNAVIAVAGSAAVLRILELAAPRDAEKALREAEAFGLFEGREILLDELAALLMPHLDVEGRSNFVRAFSESSAEEAFARFGTVEGIQKPTLDQLRAVFDAGTKSGRNLVKGLVA